MSHLSTVAGQDVGVKGDQQKAQKWSCCTLHPRRALPSSGPFCDSLRYATAQRFAGHLTILVSIATPVLVLGPWVDSSLETALN